MTLKSGLLLFYLFTIGASCAMLKKPSLENRKYASALNQTKGDNLPKIDSIGKPLEYDKVITQDALTDEGLLKVHKVTGHYYFEIADSLFDKDILIVNRIHKAATGLRPLNNLLGYSGDQIGQVVIQFTVGPNNKIYIRRMSYMERSQDSTENGMFGSVRNSNLQPIVASFDIKAYAKDSSSVVIDITNLINSDSDLLFFDPDIKKLVFNLGAYQADKSFTLSVSSFPCNLEIRSVKTYSTTADGMFVTYELNSSMVLLPKIPMKSRMFDPRVGYFSSAYIDFDVPQAVQMTTFINRWRLEPKVNEISNYIKGELVEPQKPIVFYIDPGTPKKWVPFLIQGVNDWQTAFEKAGFKNAIYAREAPSHAEDSTWSLEDTRYSAIVYKPSIVANASGPNINDPRTGEILEAHINWYHNIQTLLHKWYFIQVGPNDTNARKMEYDDRLMGQLIRFVACHEVGHTLGLMHNFGASSTIPVDSLRSKKYLEKNGFCPSIMDYARFNYVAQPEDSISIKGLLPRIGLYDEWAIEWGYRWMPGFSNKRDEKAHMNQWIISQLAKDNRYWFGDEGSLMDPRKQSEDLGNDAIKAGEYGIKNLKRVFANLVEWTERPNEDYQNLIELKTEIIRQFRRYMFHVASSVGARMYTPKTVEQNGKLWDFTSKEQQKKAIAFLNKQLFNTPYWLLDKRIFGLAGGNGFADLILLQRDILDRLTASETLFSLLFAQLDNQNNDSIPYSIDELFTDIESGIWNELVSKSPVSPHRRNLQKIYLDRLSGILQFKLQQPLDVSTSWNIYTDASTVITTHLKSLLNKINQVIPFYDDPITKAHFVDICDRIKKELNPIRGVAPEITKKSAISLLEQNINTTKVNACWSNE